MINKTGIIVILSIVVLAGGSYSLGKNLSGGSSSSEKVIYEEPGYKEFNIVMSNSRYNPSTITVNQGDRVVINLRNNDPVGHAVEIPKFNARIPGGHLPPGGTAVLDFIATSKGNSDAATCGGVKPEDKTDAHGEELIVNVI